MLLVQEFLMTKSLADLYSEHAVKVRIERGYKASFNYDQIEARDSDKLAQQCRGLIMRTADGSPMVEDKPLGSTVILARPFDRFFNQGQGEAAPVNLEGPETAIFEKLDGTLCIVHFDDILKQWHVGTRAVCEANLQVGAWAEVHTFRTLFEKALKDTLIAFEEKLNLNTKESQGMTPNELFNEWSIGLLRSRTYMFELCTPMNQVVVTHADYSVTLIGCRETQTGREFWPHEIAPALGVPHVVRHRFGNPEEMLSFVRGRDPKKFEGIVACEEYEPNTFRRVKIKNAQYLAYSRLKDSIESPRNVMTLILGENLDDAFVVMPEDIKKSALEMQEGIRLMFHDYNRDFGQLLRQVSAGTEHKQGSKEHRKAFAICAKNSGIWFEPAMMQYTGKCTSAQDFVIQKRDDNGSYPPSFLDYLIKQAKIKIEAKTGLDYE